MSSKLFSSLFNMATDPIVAPAEKDKALRAIRKICDERNRLPGDFISFDAAAEDDDFYVIDPRQSTDDLYRQIARLEAQLDEEHRTTTYLRHVLENAEEAARCEATQLRADMDALRRTTMNEIADQAIRLVERDARIADLKAQLAEQIATNDLRHVQEPVVASAVYNVKASIQDDAPRAIVDQHEPAQVEAKDWKRSEWKAFECLAAAGLTKIKMARELTRTLGRVVTTACVRELMRLRWSPSSRRRFAMWGAA